MSCPYAVRRSVKRRHRVGHLGVIGDAQHETQCCCSCCRDCSCCESRRRDSLDCCSRSRRAENGVRSGSFPLAESKSRVISKPWGCPKRYLSLRSRCFGRSNLAILCSNHGIASSLSLLAMTISFLFGQPQGHSLRGFLTHPPSSLPNSTSCLLPYS